MSFAEEQETAWPLCLAWVPPTTSISRRFTAAESAKEEEEAAVFGSWFATCIRWGTIWRRYCATSACWPSLKGYGEDWGNRRWATHLGRKGEGTQVAVGQTG